MKFIDVTLPLAPGMPLYPGDPAFAATPWSSAEESGFAVTAIQLGSHTGTHVDAPRHCWPAAGGVESLPLELLCGDAFVLDLAGSIDEAPLAALLPGLVPAGVVRLLLRTRGDAARSAGRSGIDLGSSAALVQQGVRLIGIDRLSIAAGDAALPVHRFLLAHGVVIVEGLDLSGVSQGQYGLLCLPLRLTGGDGAPARVALTMQ